MMNEAPVRRIRLTLRKPIVALYAGIRPTIVLDDHGQPAQWGTGTWQLVDGPTDVSVYLFNRLWRFGAATVRLDDGPQADLEYTAPVLPFLRGRLRSVGRASRP